jgi:hypothetical protein
MHAIAGKARWDVERIAFIWPPAVNASGENSTVSIPITTCLFVIELGQLARVVHRAM